MRNRTAIFLCGVSAVAGALAMLVGLEARHQYGLESARTAALYMANFPIHTGDPPPPPSAQALAAARPACDALVRASGLSLDEVGIAGSFAGRITVSQVDREKLDRSFSYADRLRMTLAGLSQRDRARVQASLRYEPEAARMRTRLQPLQETLRACAYLARERGGAG